MEKKYYLTPGFRILPLKYLEAFCASIKEYDQ